MTFPDCQAARQLAGASRHRFCAHPHVHCRDQLVTPEICRICPWRSRQMPDRFRDFPPPLRGESKSVLLLQSEKGLATSAPADSAKETSPQIIRGETPPPSRHCAEYQCDVVIPYFRGLRWLPQTLEAILSQNRVHCHVHLVNDASPEDDRHIRRSFRQYPNLSWYRNRKNLGPYRSYHQIWKWLQTDFFAIQDADDLPLPNRLWRALYALHSTGADIYGAAMEQMLSPDLPADDQTNRQYVRHHPVLISGTTRISAPRLVLINGTMVLRRSTFEKLNGFASFYGGADDEFITRASYTGCRFFVDETIVAIRRVHGQNLSRSGPYRMGTPARNQVIKELKRRYHLFEQAGEDLDFASFGALNQAESNLTVKLTD